jgi:glycogen debranching enzyme
MGCCAPVNRATQLTWMDAKMGDWVVTPRVGKPVEINALWYNALRMVWPTSPGSWANRPLSTRSCATVQAGFQRFILPDGAGCMTCWTAPMATISRIRPNQIFAVSLPHSPLDPGAQQAVVRVCGRELLTSYGLRSLAPRHPSYRPYYLGDVRERDSSYHQGPVWGWLLGHYALADYRVHGDAAAAQAWLDADPRSSAGCRFGHGQRDFRRRAAASAAWSAGASLVGGLHSGSLAAAGTVETAVTFDS